MSTRPGASPDLTCGRAAAPPQLGARVLQEIDGGPATILRDSRAIHRSVQRGAQRKSKLGNFSPTFWLSKDILMFQQNTSLRLVFSTLPVFFWRTAVRTVPPTDNVGLCAWKLQSRWVCNSAPHSGLPGHTQAPRWAHRDSTPRALNSDCCLEARVCTIRKSIYSFSSREGSFKELLLGPHGSYLERKFENRWVTWLSQVVMDRVRSYYRTARSRPVPDLQMHRVCISASSPGHPCCDGTASVTCAGGREGQCPALWVQETIRTHAHYHSLESKLSPDLI